MVKHSYIWITSDGIEVQYRKLNLASCHCMFFIFVLFMKRLAIYSKEE
ncbi:hypothetical protein M758_3G214900 [Ceratodon purpureus]|nr:hypothetical protein M758_3G214900 [Ceratodon purpureus]